MNVRDVGGAAYSKPVAFVLVAKTDSGSTPCRWLFNINTLLQETPSLTCCNNMFFGLKLYDSEMLRRRTFVAE